MVWNYVRTNERTYIMAIRQKQAILPAAAAAAASTFKTPLKIGRNKGRETHFEV